MVIKTMQNLTYKIFFQTIFLLSVSVSLFAQDGLGTINYVPEGMKVSQPYFKKGLALLHSFEYQQAIEQFQTAQMLDPNFVMAYWGEAMCYYYPLLNSQNYEMGKGTLMKLGIFEDDRLALAKNEIERGFLKTAETLFKEMEGENTRVDNYFKILEQLYVSHQENEELAAIYALSLINRAKVTGEDSLNATASVICKKILKENPNHPGALNYLIYANQPPERATTVVNEASRYSQVANGSEHALHAGSHIFNSLGMWDKCAAANEKAWQAVEKRVVEKKQSLEDRNYHALMWMQYAYLQQGKFDKAAEMVQDMYLDARMSDSKWTRYHLLRMKAAYLVSTEDWSGKVNDTEVPTRNLNIRTKLADLFVKGLKAYHTNDINRLKWVSGQVTDMISLERNKKYGPTSETNNQCGSDLLKAVTSPDDIKMAQVVEQQLLAMMDMKESKPQDAVSSMQKACEMEASLPFIVGPPVIVKPSYELYGELLMEMGKMSEAIDMFNASLKKYPNRSVTLKLKYQALKASGKSQEASVVKSQLLNNWKNADADVKSSL